MTSCVFAQKIQLDENSQQLISLPQKEKIMSDIQVYSKKICPYCDRAKDLLKKKGWSYTEIDLDQEPDRIKEMMTLSKRRTVPQIFINGHHIGGYDDLYDLETQGKLEEYLK